MSIKPADDEIQHFDNVIEQRDSVTTERYFLCTVIDQAGMVMTGISRLEQGMDIDMANSKWSVLFNANFHTG